MDLHTFVRNQVRKLNNLKTSRRIKLYSVNRLCVFPIKSNKDEGTNSLFYLVNYTKKDNPRLAQKYGVEFKTDLVKKDLAKLIRTSYNEFQYQLSRNEAKTFSRDGGDLGRGDNLNA